jgi:hypothetical protein
LFCESDKLKVLCLECHNAKTHSKFTEDEE